ncbi:MAG: hypothetical protein JXX29_18440, partial [Deltaproteobacteria bacterium]|nr:hypothetical protein [Deltaproteobacteria bacterium]
RKHVAMSKEVVAHNKIDLLVWSESILNTAVPRHRLQHTMKQMFNGLNTPVLLGVPIMHPIEDGKQSHYNSAVLAKPDGWVCRDCRYNKNILFPVGGLGGDCFREAFRSQKTFLKRVTVCQTVYRNALWWYMRILRNDSTFFIGRNKLE